jgi:MFS family permease
VASDGTASNATDERERLKLISFRRFADNLWLQGLAVILTSIQREFGVADNHIGYTTTALFIGLCIGATTWGLLSDVIGRRIAFNATLGIAAVFGLAVGGGSSWIGTAALFACLGTGVGGNLPVRHPRCSTGY